MDPQLRELERRWSRSGDPSDEERLIAARLRAGELTRAQVELAAYVDHAPARRVLGDAAPAGFPYGDFRGELERWVRGLKPYHRLACPRAAAAAARVAIGTWSAKPPTDRQLTELAGPQGIALEFIARPGEWADTFSGWIDDLDAWIAAPRDMAPREALRQRCEQLDGEQSGWLMHVPAAVHHAIRWTTYRSPTGALPSCAAGAVWCAVEALGYVDFGVQHVEAVVGAIRAALAPWALTPGAFGKPKRKR